MQLLMKLKYSFNRGEMLSSLLIHVKQVSFLGVLIVYSYAPFYQSIFRIINMGRSENRGLGVSLAVANLMLILITAAGLCKQLRFLKPIWLLSAIIVKLFPYLFLMPFLTYSLSSVMHGHLVGRIASTVNTMIILGYLMLHQFLNESLKFKESDYCNRRLISYAEQIIVLLAVAAVVFLGPFYGCLVYLFRAVFVISRLYSSFEYRLVARLMIFHCLWQGYVALVTLMKQVELIDSSTLNPVANSLFIFVAGAIVSWIFSGQLIINIAERLLAKTQWGGERGEGELSNDRQQNQLQHFENQIKSLVQAILQKWKFDEGQPNHYEHYWKVFNERVFLHRLRCEQKRCPCRHRKRTQQISDEDVYVLDLLKRVQGAGAVLGKQGRLKVLNINLLIEIAKKPLKGYYQLISLKRERNKLALRLEIEDLVVRARECFDQIYYKNKVQNQQLDLMKVVECEEVMTSLEEELRTALAQTASFLDMFTYSTVKMAQVQAESRKLFQIKRSIEKKLEKLVWEVGDNGSVGLALFVFYRMLEVYRSRQNELKKLGGQQVMKKRLMHKADGETFIEQQGIIYIDLVEERGRIKKITQAISDFFGYSKEDMIGFNINLFMPTLFGKYHAKFLSNFIDKGRIKLLKQRTRVVFGRNKKKFIFPINIKLKTEHLQHDQFGASAIITKLDTSSDYIIAGAHARIEETTQAIYRRIFGKTLRDDVGKLSKLCLYKLIPSLNQVVQAWEEKQANKIHEGLLIFAEKEDYLFQKFRYNRESTYSSISNKTKTLNLSMTSITSTSLPLDSKSERFDYFSQLFKNFLIDISPHRLRGIKINYKYSRIRTSEFEVEMVQIVSTRDELQGKQFKRELLNELNNVAEIYQLLEEHSPLARHLSHLQEDIDREDERRGSKDLVLSMNSSTQRKALKAYETNSYNANTKSNKEFSLNEPNSEESFLEEMEEDKKLFNAQMSEQSSLIGNTQSQSKKQLLINAFNSNQSALPTTAVFLANLALALLLVLLVCLAFQSSTKIGKQMSLWKDSSYMLDVRTIFEFRLALVELQSFSKALNFSLPQSLLARSEELNSQMSELVQRISTSTMAQGEAGPYSSLLPLYDPVRNITYSATVIQVLTQLLWLYQQPTPSNIKILRANYQALHTGLSNFYLGRQDSLQKQNSKAFSTVQYFFGFYQGLLAATAFCSLPLYIYFKREELRVRSKLAFMNVKQIRKAINKLRLTYDFMRAPYRKGAVSRLQLQLSEKKAENNQEIINANKFIKITSEAEQTKLFKNPILYVLLLAFIAFFSNLSITLFVLSSQSDAQFTQVLTANRLINNLQIKTPLLLNKYLANLNNILQGNPQTTFSAQIIAETEAGYFDVINQLSLPDYSNDGLSKNIQREATEQLCAQLNCKMVQNFSLSFIATSFRNRFNYWSPTNTVLPSSTSIAAWVNQNGIPELLAQMEYVLQLATLVRNNVESRFNSSLKDTQLLMIILIGILIPLNTAVMLLISCRFLNLLNGIIKSAEEVFMHFPVSVLIENTYLTSYFNSKAKHGK